MQGFGEGLRLGVHGLGGYVSKRPGKEGGGVVDKSVTLSRKPIQPDGWSGCHPRVRREHRKAVILARRTGTRARRLCWIACGQ